MRYFTAPLFAALLSATVVHAQSNPFAPIGKEAPVLTLTKGQYPEVFTNDTLRVVCGMMYNRVTGKVVGFVEVDTVFSESGLRPELMSRWLSMDPLAGNYPFASPYCFTLNNPILFGDYDGRDIVISHNGENFTFSTENRTYTGSNDFISQTVQALNHLMVYEHETNARYKVVTELANNASIEAYVAYVAIDQHPSGTGAAEWNPRQGTYVRDRLTGGIAPQSPVGTLLHELGHKYDDLFPGLLSEAPPYDTQQIEDYEKRSRSSPFGNFMEEGIINKIETPYYQHTGQATRGDHDTHGFFEVTGGFTSNTECFTCGTNKVGTEVQISTP